MFTGLVEEIGSVVAVDAATPGLTRLHLRGPLVTSDAALGDSISVSGVCLTVTDLPSAGEFIVDVIGETLTRSTLGALAVGSHVNLERAMALGDRLGGHIVQGHVDATGEVLETRVDGDWRVIRMSLAADAAPLVVEKGSITVDGVSLTVSAVSEPRDEAAWFEVSLIPATLRETTLGALEVGVNVNVETDILARHVQRLREFDAA